MKTSACRRVRKLKKNIILPPLRLSPGAQGGPAPKIFFAYFFLGLGHDSRKFANRYLEKKFGKKFSPKGVRPPKFFRGDCCTRRAICMKNLVSIAWKLWPVDVCENSKNVILAPLRLRPGAQGGPTPKIFFAYFFLGLGHDSGKFSDRYLEKKFGEKISPRGVWPPKFLEGDCIPPRVMCLQSFIAIALKLWPVDVGKTRGGQNNK